MTETPRCPDCDLPMEQKAFIETGNCESGCCPYGTTIYQCAKCKRIESR